MKNFIIVATIALLSYGCTTPYQSSGFLGGYNEIQLDENVFKISFHGNQYTSQERATNYTLLRSAELTLENQFKYFAIIDETNITHSSTTTTPTTYHTTDDYLSGGLVTTTTGGYTTTSFSPSTTNTIVMYREKPDSIFTYNAEFLRRSMKEKYGLQDE